MPISVAPGTITTCISLLEVTEFSHLANIAVHWVVDFQRFGVPALRAAAGLTQEEFAGILVANGMQLPSVASAKEITLGGAIATASHVGFTFIRYRLT